MDPIQFTMDSESGCAETTACVVRVCFEQKAELEARVLLVQDSELRLYRVCDQFREVRRSRNYAVALWKGVIDSLKMRDADLKLMAEASNAFYLKKKRFDLRTNSPPWSFSYSNLFQDYVNLKRELRDVTEQVKEQESLLKTEGNTTFWIIIA